MDYLTDPSFQGLNRFFVLPFENNAHRTKHTGYFFAKGEIKDYNVMIDGPKFFDEPMKNDLRTYDTVQKMTIGQGDDYATGCLLGYTYF